MSNLLKMAKRTAIQSLYAQGWPQSRIAAALQVDRQTVRKYVLEQSCGPKPTNAPTGFDGSKPTAESALPGTTPTPADMPSGAPTDSPGQPPPDQPAGFEKSKPTKAPTGSVFRPGPQSQWAPHREVILAKLNEGLSYRRIWQDLSESGVTLHYDALRRYCRRLLRRRPLPVRRMECSAGDEAQVDFGTGAPIVSADGKRRKTNVFRIVLSHSRKGYSEATYTQTTDDFLRALENAFRHFGGVPKTLVIDNLKAAVSHPDWFDPEIVPKVQAFCEHYGTVILPTKPYTPEHKGKVEAGVKYVKNNGLKGRTFPTLAEQQQHLQQWESSVADRRIHGTTKQQVAKVFETSERPALLPLPLESFSNFHEAQRKVNRDGHVEVAKAYYSAPPEYLGRTVWARWDARVVRLFNHRWEQIALHVRHEPGRFSTLGEHLAAEKINGLERGVAHLLARVEWLGPRVRDWAQAMLTARGIQGTRVLQGLGALAKQYSPEALEKACETALSHGVYRLKTIRLLLKRRAAEVQLPLPFLAEHPIIRPLDDYARVVTEAIQRQDRRSSLSESFTRHDWTEERWDTRSLARPSVAEVPPPRSDYPSSGCSSAEPNSVSPDVPSVVPQPPFHQE